MFNLALKGKFRLPKGLSVVLGDFTRATPLFSIFPFFNGRGQAFFGWLKKHD
jgi:hypothetical protein